MIRHAYACMIIRICSGLLVLVYVYNCAYSEIARPGSIIAIHWSGDNSNHCLVEIANIPGFNITTIITQRVCMFDRAGPTARTAYAGTSTHAYMHSECKCTEQQMHAAWAALVEQ